MDEVLKTVAIRVTPKEEAPDNSFFVLKMPARVLASMKVIPVRHSGRREGIQRLTDEKRIREIAGYIARREAIFPNSIIVSFGGDVDCTAIGEKEDLFELAIQVKDESAVIIDGQHRLLGIERSGIDMEVLVTAFLDIPVERQAAIFRDINFYQRKVNKSLMYDLFHVAKDAEYPLMRSIDLAEMLNEDGPLEGKIKLTGVGEGVVTQTVFVETILRFLKDDEIFRQAEYEEEGGMRTQFDVLRGFYESLMGHYKDAWADPRSYIILKTQGVYACLMLLKDILWFFHNRRDGYVPRARDFEEFTGGLSEKISFEREYYGDAFLGSGGQRRLHMLLGSTLENILR